MTFDLGIPWFPPAQRTWLNNQKGIDYVEQWLWVKSGANVFEWRMDRAARY